VVSAKGREEGLGSRERPLWAGRARVGAVSAGELQQLANGYL